MSTSRLTAALVTWLKRAFKYGGVRKARLMWQQMESKQPELRFLGHKGAISGPADFSSRKGFS